MRLILDTNILLSALLSPMGAPAKLLDAWERKRFTLVACDALVAELRDVAGRPFFRARLRASSAELVAAGIRDFSFYCRDLPPGPIAPDPKDSYLLALAEASEAEFLVTGDKELLSLKHHKSTRVIAPAAMVEILKKAENGEQRED
jgi:putative PIN family toxin of toxin-antitoxin system